MKKAIILILTSILIVVLLTTPKESHADAIDIFLNNEIYLFNNINEINFNEGYYIDKTTITEEDKNNNNNHFMWYFNLGHRLVARNFPEDSGDYKCLAIPLNNMVAKYVSFAFGFSSGPDLAIEVRYSDNSVVQYATSDYTDTNKVIYTPREQDLTKNISYIAWEIYDPDYYISFLPLTSDGYYNIGYNDGLSDGFDHGMETGYNRGYYDGYQHAITSEEIIYDTILDFNQLIKNGDFLDTSHWVTLNASLSTNDGIGEFLATAYSGYIYIDISTIVQGHKIYYQFDYKGEENTENNIFYTFYSFQTYDGYQAYNLNTDWRRSTKIFETTATANVAFVFRSLQQNNFKKIYIKNLIFIDLTQMYGEGNEPSIETCEQIFNTGYYNYTESSPVDIGYFTGYYEGREEGIQTGINIGETNQINLGFISRIFEAVTGFLSIQIFPRVTIGTLVMIPFILTFTGFIIGVIRKGGDKGGDDDD